MSAAAPFNASHLVLPLSDQAIRRCFAEWFSRGIVVDVQPGESIRDLLCRDLGLTEDYADNRIQTVFLNGRAVDDTRKARVVDGDVLAVSAAMPGLVGAVFRKGGYYASLRAAITHCEAGGGCSTEGGRITLKLFNMTAGEIGPMLLRRGVWTEARELSSALSKSACRLELGEAVQGRLNGEPIDLKRLAKQSKENVWLFFQAAPV